MDPSLYDPETLAMVEALVRRDVDACEELERADCEPAWEELQAFCRINHYPDTLR